VLIADVMDKESNWSLGAPLSRSPRVWLQLIDLGVDKVKSG